MRNSMPWIVAAATVAAALAALGATAPPNLPSALAAQKKMVADHPDDASGWNDLGNLLVLGGDVSGAESAYRKALELEPGRASTHFNLGLLLQQEQESRQALAEYREAVSIQPSFAWAHYQIGTLYEALGKDEEAVQSYARALSLDPQLAFPEVNPNIIDNHLLTEAMILAYREDRRRPLAPKAYDQPGRIAGLLLPTEPGSEGGETTGTAAEQAAGGEPPAGGVSGVVPPKILTEENLDRRSNVNQASPQSSVRSFRGSRGVAPRQIPRPGATVIYPGAVAPQGGRTGGVGPSRRLPPNETPSEGRPDGRSQGRVIVPPNRIRFQPGTPSTGRLEIELPGGGKPAAPAAG